MIVIYNGKSGGLGSYFAAQVPSHLEQFALTARLEARSELADELSELGARLGGRDEPLVFFQLAAKVSVPACEQDPSAAYKTNVIDTEDTVRDVCEWAQRQKRRLKLVYVSSGHVYAERPPQTRIDERYECSPRSVYARTKLQAEARLSTLAGRLGVPLTIARVFGLVAPVQPPNYVLPGLIGRVRERRLDDIPGLSFVRDYLDARDVSDCLLALGLASESGISIVNVCSGEATRLRDLLAMVAQRWTMDQQLPPEHAHDLLARASEARARPDDIPWIVGDPSRLMRIIGRSPRRISIAQTIADALQPGLGPIAR